MVAPGRIAAGLLLARAIDSRAGLTDALRTAAPVITIDVADLQTFDCVASVWQDILFAGSRPLLNVMTDAPSRQQVDAVFLIINEPPAPLTKRMIEQRSARALSMGLPFIAITPLATTHLPAVIVRAARERIALPQLDPLTISRTISIVTGKPCKATLDADLAERIGIEDLVVALRFGRTPEQCIEELGRVIALKDTTRASRDIALSEIHGLGEARTWAEAAIADLTAWRNGDIPWSEVASSVALWGPPGTGKTLFANAFARAANLRLIACSYAKWQGTDEGHLGHFMRAMQADFAAARAQIPSLVFIDEIDSFTDRNSDDRHGHRYLRNVINGLLAEIDGIAGREGLILISASNALDQCDPALLRAGRCDKIIRIGLPDTNELEQMLRVRLREDLHAADLKPLAEAAAGLTGADIERVVKDSRRIARLTKRALTVDDLRRALVGDDRTPQILWRHCIHEAGHILVDVLRCGPEGILATSAAAGGRGGNTLRRRAAEPDGTRADYVQQLEITLAGRLAEETLLGAAGHGAGGATDCDLDLATRLAATMVGSLGLAGHLTYLGSSATARFFLQYPEVRTAIARELQLASRSCKALLKRHRQALSGIADHLRSNGRIDGHAAAALIAAAAEPRGRA
ncbi:AAA family ATPase [Bradyrhizobium sp. USDA 4502]